jgi:hypothetical protein
VQARLAKAARPADVMPLHCQAVVGRLALFENFVEFGMAHALSIEYYHVVDRTTLVRSTTLHVNALENDD